MWSLLRMKHLCITLLGTFVFLLLPIKQMIEQSNVYNQTDVDVIPAKPEIELTVRFTINYSRLLQNLFCDLLRSTALFWNPNYGDILLTLDEEDEPKNFETKLSYPLSSDLLMRKP